MRTELRRWFPLLLAAATPLACDDWRSFAPDEKPVDPGPCRSKALVLSAGDPSENGTCRPTECSLEPNGSITMSYCVQGTVSDWPWATCPIATGQNLNDFDPDHGGRGALEVVFCTDALILGALDLWYEDPKIDRKYGRVKYLELLAPGESMEVGCRTVYLTPDKARIPYFTLLDGGGAADYLPQSCSGRCGRTAPQCLTDFGSVSLILAGEFLRANDTSDARVRILSLNYLTEGCFCADDLGCDGARSMCHEGAFSSFACDGNPPHQGGVCALGGAAECGDMVGRTASGWVTGLSDVFLKAYQRHEAFLGCPFDNNHGTPYVHPVPNWGTQAQDYRQPDPSRAISPDGQTALVYNASANDGLGDAFLLFGPFWGCYKTNGYKLLGAPLNESRMVGDVNRQDFDRGWLTLAGVVVFVHQNQAPDQAIDCSTLQ